MFLKNLILWVLLVSCIASADSTVYPTALINVGARDATDLSGQWHYIVDPLKTGVVRADSRRYSVFRDFAGPESQVDFFEYNFNAAPRMSIPGDWNGQDVSLTWYDGLVWFRRTLDLEALPADRQLLHIGAANYRALVYVNGEKVGEHEGGFTPFAFDVTDKLTAGRNSIVIGVDAEHSPTSVPTPVVDWKNFGGITRPVHLVSVPDTYIHDYFLRLDGDDRLKAEVRLGGDDVENRDVLIEIPELGVALRGKSDESGRAAMEIGVPADLQKWSPGSPALYDVTIAAADDSVADRVGFRTVEVNGSEILLNGEPVFLRGISIHEEALGAIPSRAINEARARELLSIARDDLNANFVRLAHYPHATVMTRVADEMGLLVWSEIPVYWDIDFSNEDTLALAKQMQHENIVRDRNRASIIMWSVGNETPQTEERLAFFDELIDDARRLDDSRLVTAALHNVRSEGGARIVDDPLGQLIDVVAVNTYQGWYGRMTLERVPSVEWQNPTGKPFMFSEFGAGALYGFRDKEKEKFSEEFQVAYYEATIEMAKKAPDFAGVSPRIL
ncbi:MAG: beta-glucuronidase, partial [Acidimicrobiia bacterium]|nr:beta-glucuronidase [Acidimicrobiia bacterium]